MRWGEEWAKLGGEGGSPLELVRPLFGSISYITDGFPIVSHPVPWMSNVKPRVTIETLLLPIELHAAKTLPRCNCVAADNGK